MMKLLLPLLAASFSASAADDKVWRELFAEFGQLRDKGDYREALRTALKALEEAERVGPSDARTAATLSEVAWVEGALGQSWEAEQHHLRAIRILERQTSEPLALCIALNGLSTFYVESGGRYAQAEQLSRRALAIGIGLFGPRAPELVSLLSNLATVRSIRGDRAEALLLFQNALQLLVDDSPADRSSKAFVLSNLSTLHTKMGDHAKSVSYLLQAIPLCEETLGREHPRMIALLFNLGRAYLELGNTALAEQPLRTAAAITEARLGAEHSVLVWILSSLAGRKRTVLERWFEAGVGRLHCLPWDADTGLQWAKLLARLRSAGKAMPVKDNLIAATAVVHNLTIATRNRADFVNAGVPIIDPFVG